MSEYKMTGPSMMEPAHPGAILSRILEGDEDNARVSVMAAAKALGVSRQTLHRVLAKQVGVTPDMAIRLGAFVGNGPGLWLRIQAAYDLWHAERDTRTTRTVIPIREAKKALAVRPRANAPMKIAAKRAPKRAKARA